MKTKRVRAAVIIDAAGNYYMVGWNGKGVDDAILTGMCVDCGDNVGQPESIHFIEADVPLPEPLTIEGELK